MKPVLMIAAALSLAGACATPPAPGLAESKEKKICETKTVVGRYVPLKVCQTQAEWDALKAKQAEGVKALDHKIQSDRGTFKSSGDQ